MPSRKRALQRQRIPRPLGSASKRLVATYSQNSGATGGIAAPVLIASVITATNDWSSMIASYQKVTVKSCKVHIAPVVRWQTSGTSYVFPIVTIAYSPTDTSAPTSSEMVLSHRNSMLLDSMKVQTFSFKPKLKSGALFPVSTDLFADTNILGAIRFYSPVGSFPNSTLCYYLTYEFEVVFSRDE